MRARRRTSRWVAGALGLLLWGLPAVGAAQQIQRYSGKVERVDLGEGRVVVQELAEKGRVRRHDVHVSPDTPIVSAGRLRPWEMRGSRAYDEIPVSLVDLLTGDFVVIESVQEEGLTIARRITIVESTPRTRQR